MATMQELAARRAAIGLEPDPASDRIWFDRIAAGTATFSEADRRMMAKYLENRSTTGGGTSTDDGSSTPAAPTINFRDYAPEWMEGALLDLYVQHWEETGDPNLAMAAVRRSSVYEQTFPGIRREDGSLRMSEGEYFSHREAFRREFASWGLNPQMYENHHVELIQGGVSVAEFRQRLEAKITGVMQNISQVRERFGSFYGINAMDDRTLVGAALDPEVGLGLMQGRITASQIAGEAAVQGFMRSRERSERLGNVGGLDQMRARELFSQGSRAVPRFDRFAERFNEQSGFGIEQFEDAAVFGDAQQQRRMTRLRASEQAMFTQGGTVRQDQSGMAGLRRR